MRSVVFVLFVMGVLMLSMVSGCGKNNAVVGTWTCTEDSLNVAVGLNIICNEDGTGRMGPQACVYSVKGSSVVFTNKAGKELLVLELKDGKLIGSSKVRHIVYEKKK